MQVFMKTSVPRHVPVSLYMAFYFACLQKHPNDTKALARYLSTESINAIQTYPNTFLTAICPSIKFSHSRRRSWYVCVGGSFTILRARGRHGRALLSYIFFYSLSYFLKLQSIFFFFFLTYEGDYWLLWPCGLSVGKLYVHMLMFCTHCKMNRYFRKAVHALIQGHR